MSVIKNLSIALVALTLSAVVSAQGKVAVVDFQAALLETDVAQQRLLALEAESDYQATLAQAEQLVADIRSLQEEGQANAVAWSQEQLAAQQALIQNKNVDLQAANTKLRDAQNRVLQGIFAELQPRGMAALNEIINSEGIGLLLDKGAMIPTGRQQARPVVLHVDTSFDLTPRLTERLNQEG
ncbi:MAG: OmpH family outer membrane protein [Gammaproteobacteria bacterium]|nr:OmpH family outer membrane protein [Gammaproteobacteria bacterium]